MLANNPTFSIIIPVYNSGKTLSAALDSIFIQTFKDYEVLIIDGLSADNTVEIAKKYNDQYANIRIYSERDKGIYDAMNKGIDLALGEWLFFLGSDDSFFETTTLQQVVDSNYLTTHEIVYGNVYSSYFNGSYDGVFTYSKLLQQNICHQSIFFRKSVFSKTGKFNLKYKAYADWNHNINWFFSSKITYVHINLIVANFNYGGFSSVYNDKAFKLHKIFLIISKGIGKLSTNELLICCNNYINYVKQQGNFYWQSIAYLLKSVLLVFKKITSITT